jgi:hypothetical protein
MNDREALALRHLDVVFSADYTTLQRVERVSTDNAGRVWVHLFGQLRNYAARPYTLALVYRFDNTPLGAYVRLGPVRDVRQLDAVRQAIAARQREQEQQEQDRERNDENHGTQ